jgi:hypothetical protein
MSAFVAADRSVDAGGDAYLVSALAGTPARDPSNTPEKTAQATVLRIRSPLDRETY